MFGTANKSGLTIGTPQSAAMFPSASTGTGTGFGAFGAAAGTPFGTPATSASGFGLATPGTAGFGTAFGQTPVAAGTSQSTGMFGQTTPASQPVATGLFGQTPAAGGQATGLFGQTPTAGASAAQPATGGLFGQASAFSQPASGGLFGQAASASQPGAVGLFGSKPLGTTTGFGTSALGQTGFGGFGSSTAQPATSTVFPSLGFGTQQPAASSAGSFFGGLTGFVGQAGAPAAATGTAPGLGFFGGTGLNRGLTGTTGITGAPFGSLGQQQQQQQQLQQAMAPAPAINELQQLQVALNQPAVFGDERDATLAKWNQLQASWGTGKAYFVQTAPPVDLKRQNPYCCFKAVGYSRMPQAKSEDGLIALITSKTEKELLDNQQASVNFLSQLLGNDASLSVCVESIRGLPDGKSELTIYVIQRPPTGSARRIDALELYRALTMQQTIAAQLSQGGVESVAPKFALTAEALDVYLRNPPVGIDHRLWEQAKKDNPDPGSMLPVPMVGFGELRRRLKLQEQQSALHRSRLDIIQADISQLQLAQAKTTSRIEEYKRKHLDLSHRVLKVMAKQEALRRMGFGITADEEQLRARLETLQYDLTAPAQFRGRLQELLSQVHMQSHLVAVRQDPYRLDVHLQAEIKQLLREQQAGLQHLVQVVKTDLDDMSLLEASLRNSVVKPGAWGES